MRELAASVKQDGVIQPIVVRPAPDGEGYELVAGERRLRAALYAGLETIPALVREIGDQRSAEWALIENVQRVDLNPMDRASGLHSLMINFGLTQQAAADRIGMERSSVANLLRLMELEPKIQELVRCDALSFGHAKVLLSMPSGRFRVDLALAAADNEWPVRKLASRVKYALSDKSGESQAPKERSPALVDLEKRLGEHLGTRVRIETDKGGKRGKIVAEFFDLDHFDGLVGKMGFRLDE